MTAAQRRLLAILAAEAKPSVVYLAQRAGVSVGEWWGQKSAKKDCHETEAMIG